jgi:hypothetical protein
VDSVAEDKPLISHGFGAWVKKEELLSPVGTEKKALASIHILYGPGRIVKRPGEEYPQKYPHAVEVY